MKALKLLLIVLMVSFTYTLASAQTKPSKSERRARIENKVKDHPKAAKKAKHHIKKHKAHKA